MNKDLHTNSSRTEIHVLRTGRALTVLVSLQPISTKQSRDAWPMNASVTGSCQFRSVQISLVQFVCCEHVLSKRVSGWRERSRQLVTRQTNTVFIDRTESTSLGAWSPRWRADYLGLPVSETTRSDYNLQAVNPPGTLVSSAILTVMESWEQLSLDSGVKLPRTAPLFIYSN